MCSARDIALFLMQNDPSLLSENIITRNGHHMYEGNFRLHKYMHMADNLYVAKTGNLLFSEPLYAYDNGGVVLDIRKSYQPLKSNIDKTVDLSQDIKEFLIQVINSLKGASIDELYDISHQDREWQRNNRNGDQRMDTLSMADEYREQYKDILKMMEMGLC